MAEADLGVLLCCRGSYRHCRLCGCLHRARRFRRKNWDPNPPSRPFLLDFHCHGRSLPCEFINFRSHVPLYPHLTLSSQEFPSLSSSETHTRLHLPLLLSGCDHACFCCNYYAHRSFKEAVDYHAYVYCCIPSSKYFCTLAVPPVCCVHEYLEVLS